MLEKGPERFQVKPVRRAGDGPPLRRAAQLRRGARRRAGASSRCAQDSRDALEITPMLLLGPPGIGKTHFARELAQLLGTGMGFISMSSLTAGWVLSGASSQWKGARPGKVFETLVDGQYANPVMVVDEIDKAARRARLRPAGRAVQPARARHRRQPSPTNSPKCAIDASQVIWVATANDERAHPRADPQPHERLRGAGARPRRGAHASRCSLYRSIRADARLGPAASTPSPPRRCSTA